VKRHVDRLVVQMTGRKRAERLLNGLGIVIKPHTVKYLHLYVHVCINAETLLAAHRSTPKLDGRGTTNQGQGSTDPFPEHHFKVRVEANKINIRSAQIDLRRCRYYLVNNLRGRFIRGRPTCIVFTIERLHSG